MNSCEVRVWVIGSENVINKNCNNPSVIEYDGRAYCKIHALNKLKKEFVVLADNAVANLKKLESLVAETDIQFIHQNINILNMIAGKINLIHPKKELEPAAKDQEYWMKRAKEAEKQLKDLQTRGHISPENKSKYIVNVCKHCKKECHGKVCDYCISEVHDILYGHGTI
jgi:hypothetical protein